MSLNPKSFQLEERFSETRVQQLRGFLLQGIVDTAFRDDVIKKSIKRRKVPSLTCVDVEPERFSAHLCNEIMMSHCITTKPRAKVHRELCGARTRVKHPPQGIFQFSTSPLRPLRTAKSSEMCLEIIISCVCSSLSENGRAASFK